MCSLLGSSNDRFYVIYERFNNCLIYAASDKRTIICDFINWKKMCKEAVVSCLETLPGIYLDGLRKTTYTCQDIRSSVRSRHFVFPLDVKRPWQWKPTAFYVLTLACRQSRLVLLRCAFLYEFCLFCERPFHLRCLLPVSEAWITSCLSNCSEAL